MEINAFVPCSLFLEAVVLFLNSPRYNQWELLRSNTLKSEAEMSADFNVHFSVLFRMI